MIYLRIKLKTIADIKWFAQNAQLVKSELWAIKNQWKIDPRSVLALISIDSPKGFIIQIPKEEKDFITFCKQFVY